MRFKEPGEIITQGKPGETSNLLPQPGNDDFLSRINVTISNFKELLKMAKELRGLSGQLPEEEPSAPSQPEPPGQSALAKFIQVLIQSGYGDTPISELFDQVKPYTIKQILEFAKHAGLKR